jgi:hypothetical protein
MSRRPAVIHRLGTRIAPAHKPPALRGSTRDTKEKPAFSCDFPHFRTARPPPRDMASGLPGERGTYSLRIALFASWFSRHLQHCSPV